MKISKKVHILILIILALTIICSHILKDEKKYVLSDKITSSAIDSLEIFHNDDSSIYDTKNSKGIEILKDIKKILSRGTFNMLDGAIMFYNDFPKTCPKDDSDNYSIKINFNSNTEVKLNNTSITCKYIVLDINEKILYYWFQASSTINEMSIEDVDLKKLEKYFND